MGLKELSSRGKVDIFSLEGIQGDFTAAVIPHATTGTYRPAKPSRIFIPSTQLTRPVEFLPRQAHHLHHPGHCSH